MILTIFPIWRFLYFFKNIVPKKKISLPVQIRNNSTITGRTTKKESKEEEKGKGRREGKKQMAVQKRQTLQETSGRIQTPVIFICQCVLVVKVLTSVGEGRDQKKKGLIIPRNLISTLFSSILGPIYQLKTLVLKGFQGNIFYKNVDFKKVRKKKPIGFFFLWTRYLRNTCLENLPYRLTKSVFTCVSDLLNFFLIIIQWRKGINK